MDKKKAIIAVAIALIFALFVGYGIEVFDPSPNEEDFCPRNVYELSNETECVEAGGVWNNFMGEPEKVKEISVHAKDVKGGFCNPPKECYDRLSQARTQHDKIVFIAAVIVGLLAVITGTILKKDTVSNGIVSGGVLIILYGTIRYWQHANNTLKFILLGVALAVLVWIGYKKLEGK